PVRRSRSFTVDRRLRRAATAPSELDTVTAVRVSRAGFLSPVVRRLLAQHGLEPSDVTGTGAGGRITRGDVEAVVAARGHDDAAESPEPAAASVAPPPPSTPSTATEERGDEEP